MKEDRPAGRGWGVALLCITAFASACGPDEPATDTESSGSVSVSVSGTVYTGWIASLDEAVGGVVVEVVGQADASAVTDEHGSFTIDGLTPGEVVWFAVPPSQMELGSVAGLEIPPGDVEGLTIVRLARAELLEDLEALKAMDPDVAYDATRGSILVGSSTPAATIALDPMPPPGHVYALAQGGTPMLDATSSGDAVPAVVFFNLDPALADAVELSVAHPSGSCEIPLSGPPIRADHVSLISVRCEPP